MTSPPEVGYWTGSLGYTPSAGNLAQLTPVSIPLGAVDGNGVAWIVTKLEGWDGPDVQGGGIIGRSGDHGGFATPQFYAPRAVTLSLRATAPTQALRDVARAALQQAVPISDLATLAINEPIPKQVYGRRSGKIAETYPTLYDVDFSVVLVCPDPRKYSVQAYSQQVNASASTMVGVTIPVTVPFTFPNQTPGAGSLMVTNHGTFETRPVITITGPLTGPQLTNVTTGQTVSWDGVTLGPADTLVADFTRNQALLDGVYVPADLTSSWWVLPPGASTVVLNGGGPSSGSGFTVAWADAFI